MRAALREGLAFPYECNVGSCGNCKFELLEGEVNSSWVDAPGLSEKDKLKNKWLGCQTHAMGDLQIKLRTADKYKPVHTPLKTEAWLRGSRTITHDLSEAMKLGDRIAIMRDGAVVQMGTPEELVANPADDYVDDFIRDIPKSHVLTLRAIARPLRDDEDSTGPEIDVSTIIRDATPVIIGAGRPVKVVDGGVLIGVVTSDDVLRLIGTDGGDGQ